MFRGRGSRQAQCEVYVKTQTNKNYQEKSEKKGNRREIPLPDYNIYYKASLIKIYYKASLIRRQMEQNRKFRT